MPIAFRPLSSVLALSAGLVASGYASDAPACGGLFCNAAAPVNQTAERIIFAKNDDGTVTAAIEILFEGPAHEFAWVLPVPPGETAVGVSSKNALDQLDNQSNPRYQLNRSFDDCNGNGVAPQASSDPRAGGDDSEAPGKGITVVAEGNAGPYIYTQIMADPALKDPAAAALEWLAANNYDVTKLGPELLGGYLNDGMNLIAFKLQKGKDAGSIRPVLLTYKSKRPIIPIKPTAVAANDDMGVKVWVLGDSRAISINYPDLVLNESLIDWFNPNNTYNDVVIAAANETKEGQGFVTEQSGPAGAFADAMYPDGQAAAWQQLRTGQFGSKQEFLERARDSFANFDGFTDVMLDPKFVPVRLGATQEDLLTCISCYFQADVPVRNDAYPESPYLGAEDPIHTLDVPAFLKQFYKLVIEPLEKTRALFDDHAAVTRFYTTLSAEEMTLDPEFDFNADLPDIDNLHQATQNMSCENDGKWSVSLPQGMVIRGQDRTWPVILGDTPLPVNLRVVQLSRTGEGEVVKDNSKKIAGLLTSLKIGSPAPKLTDPNAPDDDTNTAGLDDESSNGGGCSVTAPGADWGLLPALGLVLPLVRRRRSPRLL